MQRNAMLQVCGTYISDVITETGFDISQMEHSRKLVGNNLQIFNPQIRLLATTDAEKYKTMKIYLQ